VHRILQLVSAAQATKDADRLAATQEDTGWVGLGSAAPSTLLVPTGSPAAVTAPPIHLLDQLFADLGEDVL